MKLNHTSQIALAAVLTLASSVSWGQKKTETDAALAFKSFETQFQAQDMENAKKSLLKAKGFIDQAATNAETEKSPKTLFYKGEIYASIQMVRALGDANFNSSTPENAMDIAVDAYKTAYTTSDKFDVDIENSVNSIRQMTDMMGVAAFDGKKYKEAAQIYDMAAKASSAIGQTDSISVYYAAISSQNAQDWDNAAKYYRMCAEMNYKPEETYLNAATALISAKKEDEAMKFLDESIHKAPKNKYLYYVLGTIYMDKNDDAKVAENLGKAVEIDPKFSDAQFNLGSYFFGKGMEIRNKAADLTATEKAKQEQLLAESSEYLKKSVTPLETYIELVPTDKDVLKSLWQIHRMLKNTEKEAKYKALYEAAK